jgi:hypothetical protein
MLTTILSPLKTLLAPGRSSLQQLLRVRAISGITPDHFYEAVCDLIDGRDGGVQSKKHLQGARQTRP